MKKVESAFLSLLRDTLKGESVQDPELSPEEWEQLFRLCKWQKLLPLILNASTSLPSFRSACGNHGTEKRLDTAALQEECFREINRQVYQENDLLDLLLSLREEGLTPLVVKGVTIRQLYPVSYLRPSVDEDLLIPPREARTYHNALIRRGILPDQPDIDPDTVSECSYHKPQSPTYLEVHQALFEPSSSVYGSFNQLFNGCFLRSVEVKVQDVSVHTLCPTDHLLFLILHAYKHFVHSGFGLRIAADICLFTQQYEKQIELDSIYADCRDLRCHRFASAIYQIGEKYLGISAPEPFASVSCDILPLLSDMLNAGLHGQDIDRLHSANITLGTIASDRKNNGKKKASGGIRGSLFPSAESLQGRYPYLQKNAWLLPVAWTQRIGAYLLNKNGNQPVSHPAASIRIGKERVALLRQYGIIGKDEP